MENNQSFFKSFLSNTRHSILRSSQIDTYWVILNNLYPKYVLKLKIVSLYSQYYLGTLRTMLFAILRTWTCVYPVHPVHPGTLGLSCTPCTILGPGDGFILYTLYYPWTRRWVYPVHPVLYWDLEMGLSCTPCTILGPGDGIILYTLYYPGTWRWDYPANFLSTHHPQFLIDQTGHKNKLV